MGETKEKKTEAKKETASKRTSSKKMPSKKTPSKKATIIRLVVALLVVVVGGVLFVGATSGWFSEPKVVLDEEYYGEGANFTELSSGEYEGLINNGRSFVIFVDQNGCTTAERLKGYMTDYMTESGILAYKMMFSEAKESSLHNEIKYYPSVVIVSKGKVVAWLKADSDEDAPMYNSYEDFDKWMKKYLK